MVKIRNILRKTAQTLALISTAIAAPVKAQTIDATTYLANANHVYGLGGIPEPVLMLDVGSRTGQLGFGTFTKWRMKDFTVSETDIYIAFTPGIEKGTTKLSADVRYWRNNITNPHNEPQFTHQELATTMAVELPYVTLSALYTFGLEGTNGSVFEGCVSRPVGPITINGCELHNNRFYTKQTGLAMRSVAASAGTCTKGISLTVLAQRNFSHREDYQDASVFSVSIGACQTR